VPDRNWKVTMDNERYINRLVSIILENDLEMVLTRDEILASVSTLEELAEWAVKAYRNAQEVVYGV